MTTPDQTSPGAAGATVRSGTEESEIRALLDLLEDSEVFLGGYTDEELSVVLPPEDADAEPLVTYPYVDMLDEERCQLVQAAAMRSLIARRALVPSEEPGTFAATGALGMVVALRSTPISLMVVERVSEENPTRWVVYGLADSDGDAVLEELVTPLGHHDFVIRSARGEAEVLAAEILGGASLDDVRRLHDSVTDDSTLESVLGDITEIVRLYSLVTDGEDFRELEAVVARGKNGGPAVCVFPPDDGSDDDQLMWPSPERLSITDLVLAVLRQDVDLLNAAMESD